MARDTQKLYDALNNNNGAYELFYLIINSNKISIRQYAAIVLRKHFTSEDNWKKYNSEQQLHFKESTLQATFSEKNHLILCALTRLLAKMLQRSVEQWCTKAFNVLWHNLISADPAVVENASLIFVILIENVPELFLPHMKKVRELNYVILNAAQMNVNHVNKTTLNILNGISKMLYYMSEEDVRETYEVAMPVIFTMFNVYAKGDNDDDADSLAITFDILEDFNSITPAVFTAHIKRFVEFCLNTSFNADLQDDIRSRTIFALCWLVEENKTEINNLNLVLPVVKSLFDLIVNCTKEEIDMDRVMEDDDSSTLSAACEALDSFANHMPSKELYPMLMDLINSAMQNNEDEALRRTGLMVLAVTVEGFADIIKECKHESYWVDMIKISVHDPSVYVRCASFFALGQCTEHLKPEILIYSKDIMPILLEFLSTRIRNSNKSETERKYVNLIFYALNYFCKSLNYNELEPYLPALMNKLYECSSPNTHVKNIRELAFESIRELTKIAGERILPYVGPIIALLQPYLGPFCPGVDKDLRTNAICTLEVVARAIGKDYFQPLLDDSITLILMLLEESDDSADDEMAILLSFTSAITNLYSDKAGMYMHKVIEYIFDIGLERNLPDLDGNNMEIDYENYSDNENDHDIASNQLLCESMNTLVIFCKFCNPEFKQYLKTSLDKCFALLNDHSEAVRQSAIDSCSEFLNELVKYEDIDRTEIKQVLNQFASKIIEIIGIEKKIDVGLAVITALQNYVISYGKLEKLNEQIIKSLLDIIVNCLKGELNCQVEFYIEKNDDNDKLCDLALKTAITTLLCNFSTAITQDEFLPCFEKICPVLLEGVESADCDHEWLEDREAISIYCMGSCITALGKYTAKYYEIIFNLMFNGLRSESCHIQNDAMCGLGELVYQAGACSYASFPHILKELSRLTQENKTETIEMICCTLARLILTNHTLVPVTDVLPLIVRHVPLEDHVTENLVVFECLKFLYMEERELFLQYFREIVERCLKLIDKVKQKVITEECHLTAFELINELRNTYQEQFEIVLAEYQELNQINNCE